MYGLPENIKHLSPAEEQVMLALWAAGAPALRADIEKQLENKGGARWAESTLLNFLYRLEEKGWVKQGREANRNTYTPTVTKRAYGVAVMRERTATVFGGDVPAAVHALISESGAGQATLERARAAIDEKIAAAEQYDLYDPYG